MTLLDILKTASTVSLTALPFTFYFYWTKLGHKVAASYSWRLGRLEASGIGKVTLINLKDRSVPVFEMHAVMDGLSFTLKQFDPPLILKAMEAVNVEIDSVSQRYLGHKPYDWGPPAGKPADVDIFLCTTAKTIKCRRQGPPSSLGFALKHKLPMVITETNTFNGVIYNDRARFAITYTEDGRQETALVDDAGVIHWRRFPNGLQPTDIRSKETVTAALMACGVGTQISPFAVDDLHEGRLRRNRR